MQYQKSSVKSCEIFMNIEEIIVSKYKQNKWIVQWKFYATLNSSAYNYGICMKEKIINQEYIIRLYKVCKTIFYILIQVGVKFLKSLLYKLKQIFYLCISII